MSQKCEKGKDIHDDHNTAEYHDNHRSQRSERDGTKTAQQTQGDLDHEEHQHPEVVVTKEILAERPWHCLHSETEGNLIGKTSSVQSDDIGNIEETSSNLSKVLPLTQYPIYPTSNIN